MTYRTPAELREQISRATAHPLAMAVKRLGPLAARRFLATLEAEQRYYHRTEAIGIPEELAHQVLALVAEHRGPDYEFAWQLLSSGEHQVLEEAVRLIARNPEGTIQLADAVRLLRAMTRLGQPERAPETLRDLTTVTTTTEADTQGPDMNLPVRPFRNRAQRRTDERAERRAARRKNTR